MGDLNQLHFVEENLALIRGPVLEVGSKDYGSTPDFRALLPGCQYLGVDQEAGKGVDYVVDLTADLATITAALPVTRFNTIICFSVLEHCRQPFKMCENLAALLDRGGLLFVSVPFSWEIHAFPSDYWRFTPEGVKLLFPGFDFEAHPGHLSTGIEGETGAINAFTMRVETGLKRSLHHGRCGVLAAVTANAIKRLGLLPHIFRYGHLFPPVMVNMIGVKQ